MNSAWPEKTAPQQQKITYNIGHALSGSIGLIALVIILIKLCLYKNKEMVSLKNQWKISSVVQFIILLQYFYIILGGCYAGIRYMSDCV